MDPSKGRGRGIPHLMLQALKKSQLVDSPPESEETSPRGSAAPSIVSATTVAPSSVGGRGHIAAMLLAHKQQQLLRPGGPSFSPASDVSPSAPPAAAPVPRGVGRGLQLLQNLKAAQAAAPKPPVAQSGQGDVADLTKKMAESTVASTVATTQATSVGKNKYFREVKETPPVVMKGNTGSPCDVTANFVRLNFEENSVFEYEVVFDPDQDYKHLRFKLLNEHNAFFKQKTFDGTTLYVPHMLPPEALKLVSTNPFDESKVNITIIFRRTRRLSEMIHLYNVLFKQIMKDLQLVRFGRQHFNEHAAVQIPQHKLEVWPGYVTAVDEYEGGLMLTLDSTSRVLRTQSVLEFIKETVQTQGAKWKQAMTELLVGCSVMTTYNKKLFRVDSIDDTMTPKSTFEKKENGELIKISYIDYYKKSYGIDILDWNQPMLISRETKRMPGCEAPTEFMICIVPELCQLTGLSESQRTNFRLMKDVATYTRITPNQRHAAFKKYIQNVLENESARDRLKGWGLSIAPETVNLVARTLPPETLYFGKNATVVGKPNADWNGDVTRNAVMQAVDIIRWTIIYTKRDEQVTKDFLSTLKRCCGPMGVMVQEPQMVMLQNDRTDAYVQALKKSITSNTQLVVCMCPTSRDDRYAAIKKICCAENPVPSQVINARTVMNAQKVRSVTQKILLQINCKLGGTLWNISIPFKTAMVVGIDTYHDAGRKKRSVCAFIASYNQAMTHWYSKAVFQERGQEIVDGLKSCLVDALKHYLRVNGTFPDKIIMFRDGVGDGQLKVVQDYEIPQMKICFSIVNETYKPTLTYVVVQKRINTRIFMRASSGFENPHPGTVLDHTVTRRDWYDFLIVSQKVNQGTVTPTHYVVVHDDSGMTPDQCQRLTYKMCHLYYNWPGTVRVPAPCQYAHKLAYLVGQNIHQQPSEALSDKLFFL
ncbi:piwi-like protein Ago3 isoform X1 [Choristoneura fumiferana]|uniref:piwi-like protein Ago3 isoform X1 n=1 Tax=Choristoneura fumiferana TaxID=7141 RepID=UPI003D15B132